MRNLDIMIANPSGNITIFVLSKVDEKDYRDVATALLSKTELQGEQVSFIKSLPTEKQEIGQMQMCGLEFCGNASRSFGLICAKHKGIIGRDQILVNVSGCDHPLNVDVNTITNDTKIKMPLPLDILSVDFSHIGLAGPVSAVNLDGIMHIVLEDIPADATLFNQIKEEIMKLYNPPAIGVLFYDTKTHYMTPVVYVKDIDTVYFEGSCGSGTTAISAYFSLNKPDGSYTYSLVQPAGTIDSIVEVKDAKIETIYIKGSVDLSDIMQISVDI